MDKCSNSACCAFSRGVSTLDGKPYCSKFCQPTNIGYRDAETGTLICDAAGCGKAAIGKIGANDFCLDHLAEEAQTRRRKRDEVCPMCQGYGHYQGGDGEPTPCTAEGCEVGRIAADKERETRARRERERREEVNKKARERRKARAPSSTSPQYRREARFAISEDSVPEPSGMDHVYADGRRVPECDMDRCYHAATEHVQGYAGSMLIDHWFCKQHEEAFDPDNEMYQMTKEGKLKKE